LQESERDSPTLPRPQQNALFTLAAVAVSKLHENLTGQAKRGQRFERDELAVEAQLDLAAGAFNVDIELGDASFELDQGALDLDRVGRPAVLAQIAPIHLDGRDPALRVLVGPPHVEERVGRRDRGVGIFESRGRFEKITRLGRLDPALESSTRALLWCQ